MKKSFLFLALSITLFLFIGCDKAHDNLMSAGTIRVDVVGNYIDTLHAGDTNKTIAMFKFFEITGGNINIRQILFDISEVFPTRLSNIRLYDVATGKLLSQEISFWSKAGRQDLSGHDGICFSELNIDIASGATMTIEVRADIIGIGGQFIHIMVLDPNDFVITDMNSTRRRLKVNAGTTDTSFPIGDNISRHPIK